MASSSSISGTLYFDNNADSRLDGSDSVLPFFPLTLLGPDGSAVATTTSDKTGHYSFSGLAAGTYTVVFGTTNGYRADQGTVDAKGFSRLPGVTLDGTDPVTLDQGFYLGAAVAGTVYGAGGQGVDGATVRAVDASGTVVATATTSTASTTVSPTF